MQYLRTTAQRGGMSMRVDECTRAAVTSPVRGPVLAVAVARYCKRETPLLLETPLLQETVRGPVLAVAVVRYCKRVLHAEQTQCVCNTTSPVRCSQGLRSTDRSPSPSPSVRSADLRPEICLDAS